MNKLKEWLLNIDDENIDNDYVIRVVSISNIQNLTEVMELAKRNTVIVKIMESSIEQRVKDILNGFLLGCDGYIYVLDNTTIIISTKITIVVD